MIPGFGRPTALETIPLSQARIPSVPSLGSPSARSLLGTSWGTQVPAALHSGGLGLEDEALYGSQRFVAQQVAQTAAHHVTQPLQPEVATHQYGNAVVPLAIPHDDYMEEDKSAGWKKVRACMFTFMALAIAAAAYVLFCLPSGTTLTTTLEPGHYDCASAGAWPEAQKLWCCRQEGKCNFELDCMTGYDNWRTEWTQAKKDWCCQHQGKACGTAPVPQYDCNVGAEAEWLSAKKAWCCLNAKRGCPSTTPGGTYDCNAGWAQYLVEWAQPKKEWCCVHYNRGCRPGNSTYAPGTYDCNRDVAYMQDWPPAKKTYCCQRVRRGCPVTTTTVAGTTTTTKSRPLFDCEAAAEGTWETNKKIWCCRNIGKGCGATAPPPPPPGPTPATATAPAAQPAGTFDCVAGLSDWARAWSPEQKDWCCKNHGQGCQVIHTTPFDCALGFETLQGWTDAKKVWCCREMGRGCPPGQVIAFDCNAGYENWAAAWSAQQQDWCCANTGRGCAIGSNPRGGDFDCETGFNAWERLWTKERQVWCCANSGKGCII